MEIVNFGKHTGERWTRIPVSYLKWMINAEHSQMEKAQAEMDRRGTSVDPHGIGISGHALDRFSQRRLHVWEEHRQDGDGQDVKFEGIHAFLVRVSKEAMEKVEPRGDKFKYLGMKLVIDTSMAEPVLKSVV